MPLWVAMSSESLRSALVRLASVKPMRLSPQPPSAVSFEPLRSALVRSASVKSMRELSSGTAVAI